MVLFCFPFIDSPGNYSFGVAASAATREKILGHNFNKPYTENSLDNAVVSVLNGASFAVCNQIIYFSCYTVACK